MARFINSNLPGVTVPEKLIRELEGLPRDQLAEKSLKISVDLLKKIKPLCQAVHFIPGGVGEICARNCSGGILRKENQGPRIKNGE